MTLKVFFLVLFGILQSYHIHCHSSESDNNNYPWVVKPECQAPRATFDPKTLRSIIPRHNKLTSPPIKYLQDFASTPSWSQAKEDHAIYHRFFSDKKFIENGFFLEIGGLDGATFSNTFLFEQVLGWKGMLIEGNSANYEKMIQTRPCTQNIWSAICPKRRSHIFMTDRMGASEQIKNYSTAATNRKRLILTPCRTLADLFREYNVQKIDFMSVDVEGAEADVLATINFNRVEIAVLIAENDRMGSRREECIDQKGAPGGSNNSINYSTSSTTKCTQVDRIMAIAGMIKVPSNAKDLPACVTGTKRQTIFGSSVYVNSKYRDDVCQ